MVVSRKKYLKKLITGELHPTQQCKLRYWLIKQVGKDLFAALLLVQSQLSCPTPCCKVLFSCVFCNCKCRHEQNYEPHSLYHSIQMSFLLFASYSSFWSRKKTHSPYDFLGHVASKWVMSPLYSNNKNYVFNYTIY